MADLPSVDEFGRALRVLAERGGVITLDLSPLHAWAVMCLLQLALQHPGATGPTGRMAREVAEFLERELATDDPVLARVAAAGWQPEHDVPIAGIRHTETGPALIPLPGDTFCVCSRCGQPIPEQDGEYRYHWEGPPKLASAPPERR